MYCLEIATEVLLRDPLVLLTSGETKVCRYLKEGRFTRNSCLVTSLKNIWFLLSTSIYCNDSEIATKTSEMCERPIEVVYVSSWRRGLTMIKIMYSSWDSTNATSTFGDLFQSFIMWCHWQLSQMKLNLWFYLLVVLCILWLFIVQTTDKILCSYIQSCIFGTLVKQINYEYQYTWYKKISSRRLVENQSRTQRGR